ncbi:hypothetical protein [Hymenobacter crusticola]|nr:hypothetical protein [Hymenobacter crusticola]
MLCLFTPQVKQVLRQAYDQLPEALVLNPKVSHVTVQDLHEFREHEAWE